MSDILEERIPTQLELRDMLEEMVRLDLLGPAGGPEEELDERTVRSRYIVGLLAPRGQRLEPEELDALAVDGAEDGQDGKSDDLLAQTASFLPSSIGMTFTVEREAEAIQIRAAWGYYARTESDYLERDDGSPRLVWKRTPVEGISEPIPIRRGRIGPWLPNPETPDVYVTGLCRPHADAWTITLFLVNAQTEPQKRRDESWVFQPELAVRAADLSPIFIKRQIPPELATTDPEDRAMEMLYRREVEFAVGHGVATEVDLASGYWDRAVEVRTSVIPFHDVERMDPPTAEEIPLLGNVVLDMGVLAETPTGEFVTALVPLVEAYDGWIADQQARLENPPPDLAAYGISAEGALTNCREALNRIWAGIALLDANDQAAEAFRFANRAMALQRIRSIYTREVRQGRNPDLAEIDVPANRSWRPFQLAFVLLNLPALVNPTHPERSHPTDALADLLWFPTGGGKTEAYLGVAAFTMAIRRLQGDLGGLSGGAGVTVLMRYTLRLLTLQQFQRATALICACEVIRRENTALWGPEPFRIGLWVGQRSTPNWTKQSAENVKRDHGSGWGGRVDNTGTPAQLTNCPWCGKPIVPGRDIKVEEYKNGRARTFQYCSDKLGNCPFSRKPSKDWDDEGLPIVVVDEEIYRRLPTLLIATVDKFAQMPWKGETQMLFGRVNGYCPRHGYRSPEIEDEDSHRRKGFLPACKTEAISPLRPPDLIIQDELHLISGPLGTLVGLYETAVDALCSWDLDGHTVRPKVIASTATIRRSQSQIHNLFLRDVRIFPPSALDVGDNFFSRHQPSSDSAPARRYLGICAPGTRLKTVLIRVYVAFMAAAQKLFDDYGEVADPWMTLVGYFNSMRELGGMRRVADDAVRTRLFRMAERGLADRSLFPQDVEELTSRIGASGIPKILDRLETPFKPTREKNDAYPLDIVLATNMISVGVDVSRLGLMVVASQPKATAEYIQATSRVGRRFPGIVCTVYNWARPRDLSHYERFGHYHATFYQQVEALSVTPFSPRALDRGLSAVLGALVRLPGSDYNANQRAGQLDRSHPYVEAALGEIRRRGRLVRGSQEVEEDLSQWLEYRLDTWLAIARNTASGGGILGYKNVRDGRTLGLLKQPTEEDWDTFTCLNSLRDVEPGVALILQDHGMASEPLLSESEADDEQ